MMLSQLLTTDLDVDATYWTRGKRVFFSSMSENTDKNWAGSSDVSVVINNCYSKEQLERDEKALS